MNDDWLDIPDENIDAEEIMERIRTRITHRGSAFLSKETEDPVTIAEAFWQEMIGDATGVPARRNHVPIQQRDCDVVPRHYVIDWRVPILGPIHALVRRIINAEIRRYLLLSLEKQSYFNRQMLRILKDLIKENKHLRQEIKELGGTQE
jgi:hypothetical protein